MLELEHRRSSRRRAGGGGLLIRKLCYTRVGQRLTSKQRTFERHDHILNSKFEAFLAATPRGAVLSMALQADLKAGRLRAAKIKDVPAYW